MRNRPLRSLVAARPAALLPALVPVLLAALLLALPRGARAQSFFAESDALRPRTALELTLSDLTDNSEASSGGPLTYSNVDSSLRRLDGRFRASVLAAGAVSEARRFHQVTDSFTLRDNRDQSAGYTALVFEGLLADDDALYLVLSSSQRHERFDYQSYERLLDARVGAQEGLVYRIGLLIAGYIRGHEELQLRVNDPTLPFAQELYPFDYTAWLAGVQLGDPEALGLLLLWQRKNTPAVPGTAIGLEAGFEELRRASLSVGRASLDYSQVRVKEAFTGQSSRDTTEREISLGLQLTQRFLVAASQRHISDVQGFTLLGVPGVGQTDRTENLVRFQLRF